MSTETRTAEVPEKRLMDLVRIEAAAENLIGRLAPYTDSDGRGRVTWPVDRDGESEPQDDELALALFRALERRTVR